MLTIIAITVFVGLGQWQLDRAAQKQRQYAGFLDSQAMPPYNPATARQNSIISPDLAWRNIVAVGSYDINQIYLLDNQVVNGVAGYHVLSPFNIDGAGLRMLVNRGWISAGENRDAVGAVHTPAGRITIKGRIYFPEDNKFIDESLSEELDSGVIRLQEINPATISRQTDVEYPPFIILLDPDASSGFTRDWRQPGSDEMRHRGYAFQWLLFAAVALVLYIVLNLKKDMNG